MARQSWKADAISTDCIFLEFLLEVAARVLFGKFPYSIRRANDRMKVFSAVAKYAHSHSRCPDEFNSYHMRA